MIESEFDYHIFVGFYTGGPYTVTIWHPADTVFVGDTVVIPHTVDSGADSTSAVRIDLDRAGGAGGYNEPIFERDWFDRVAMRLWVVTGPVTDNARLRIKADDYAGNFAEDTSWTFVIASCGQLAVSNETLMSDKPAITHLDLDYDATSDHELTLQVYRLDNPTWTLVDTPYQGEPIDSGHTAIQWTIDSAHQGVYTTYRMVCACSTFCGSYGPIRSDTFSLQLAIANTPPVISQSLFLQGNVSCVEFSENTLARVFASDEEDGSDLSYHWSVRRGSFAGGLKQVVTSIPEIRYFAPVTPLDCDTCPQCLLSPDGMLPKRGDTLSVLVYDRGGAYASESLYFNNACLSNCGPPPACDCSGLADVNVDLIVDVFDVIYLVDIVTSGAPTPPWMLTCPVGRGDVNADGVYDVFDVVVLTDYVFSGGSIADPCTP